jgi:hypothetical protein
MPVCPTTTLAPAASTTCTATYVTTQADVVQGNITNVATAAALDPAGRPVTSPESTVIIPSNATPVQPPVAPESPITPVNVPVTG